MSTHEQSEAFRAGQAALAAGSYDAARRHFRAVEEEAGTASETYAQLRAADALLEEGKLVAAARLYDAVLGRNPSVAGAHAGLARIALLTDHLEEGKVHAVTCMKLAPECGLGFTLVGLVLERLDEEDQAVALLQKGVALSPDDALCRLHLGRVLAARGDVTSAIDTLEVAVRLAPERPDPYLFLGLAHRVAQRYDRAIEALRRATTLAPTRRDVWATLGDVFFEVRDFEAARAAYDAGLTACGEHPLLLERVLSATMMLDDPSAAVGYLERQLAVAPNHERGWLNLANLSMVAGLFSKAEAAVRALLARNPSSWEAHYVLGNLFAATDALELAERAYRQAMALDSTEWKPLLNLATMLLEGTDPERYPEALALLDKASLLAPEDEWRIPYDRALALTRLGRRAEALAAAAAIVKAAPAEHPISREARRLVANLEERTLARAG